MEEPALDFYLSEMSVSDRHGGGLTLQRVLGADLDRVRWFVHVARFAGDYPAAERWQPRCLDLSLPFDSDRWRRRIGSRPADWLSRRRPVQIWQGKQVAAALAARFAEQKRPLRALVCPQGAASLYAVEALTRRRPVDYLSWMMDDHLVRWRDGSWQYPPGIEAVLARHLREARRVFVISPVMAEFYQRHFGVASEVLLPPAEGGEEPVWESPGGGQGCRLGYFGNLGTWAKEALDRLVPRLGPLGASLDIYGPGGQPAGAFAHPGVRLCGRVAAADLRSTMRRYDAVLLPVSFAAADRHMAEFNIATRMSECLASGTVTLVIGPAHAAMVRFLEPTGAACLVTDESLAHLSDLCKDLIQPDFRRSVLEKAGQLVRTALSTGLMRARWSNALAVLHDGA